MVTFLQQLANGLIEGSLYALLGIAITITFGLTGIVNFAYGAFLALGAYIMYAISTGSIASFVFGIVVAAALVGALNGLGERALFRRTLGRPIAGFLISTGIILICESALEIRWGANPLIAHVPLDGLVHIGPVELPGNQIVVLIIAVLSTVGFCAFLYGTTIGCAIRSIAMDREAADLVGIPVATYRTVLFVLAGIVVAIAGALLTASNALTPFMGDDLLLKGFAVALIGGLGSVPGAVAMSYLLAIVEAYCIQAGLGGWVDVGFFALTICVLLLRPQGLGRGVEVGV